MELGLIVHLSRQRHLQYMRPSLEKPALLAINGALTNWQVA